MNAKSLFTALLLGGALLTMLALPAPSQAAPMRQDAYLQITNVSLNGGGSTVTVAPGQPVTIAFDYQLWNPDAMAGSINQIVVGLENSPLYCAYDGVPGRSPGQWGRTTQTIAAPLQPGAYRVMADREARYSCPDAVRYYGGPKTPFAAIVVTAAPPPPLPPSQPPVPVPLQISFWADRTNLRPGECTTLHWDVEHVNAVYLDGRGVIGHDTRTVCPGNTTTYTLVIWVGGWTYTRLVTIAVLAQPAFNTYSLINLHTQMCLEAHGGASVVQTACRGTAEQQWSLMATGDGSFQLASASTHLCLGATDIDIVQSDCRVSPAWSLLPFGGYYDIAARSHALSHSAPVIETGPYYLISLRASGKCVDVDGWNHDDPGRIIYWNCSFSDNDNQLWAIR